MKFSIPTLHSLPRILGAVALVSMVTLSGCATSSPAGHRYLMQGQVLSVEGTELTVCVGESHGAEVGQVLQVVRNEPVHHSKGTNPIFARKQVGTVRIEEILDGHYSKAKVLDGAPQVNDSVELNKL